tara:strand:- start:380 stop:778 length:399 start_codon:yes stop_codon:yes gene_type:complete
MSYTAYTDEEVFLNPAANIACNRLYDILVNKVPDEAIVDHFALTLNAARMVQGATVADVDRIAFITDSDPVFNFFLTQLGSFFELQQQINFQDRIQIIYTEQIFIEIWYVDDIGTVNDIDGLYVQDPADIPV